MSCNTTSCLPGTNEVQLPDQGQRNSDLAAHLCASPPCGATATNATTSEGFWSWMFPPSQHDAGAALDDVTNTTPDADADATVTAQAAGAGLPNNVTTLNFEIQQPPATPLGLRLRTVRKDSEVATLIVKVYPNSVAATAGLCRGMRILNINGIPISDTRSAIDTIHTLQSASVHLEVSPVDWAMWSSPLPSQAASNSTATTATTTTTTTHERATSATGHVGSISVRSASCHSLSSLLDDYVLCDDAVSVSSYVVCGTDDKPQHRAASVSSFAPTPVPDPDPV